jgi:hypothetical protein
MVQSHMTKTAWYWHENRHVDQRSRIGNSHSCSHLILKKESKTHMGKKTASSINNAGKTEHPHVEI